MAASTEKNTSKSSPSLTQNLNYFLEYTAKPRRREINRTQERIIRRAVNPILQEIGSFDDRFSVDPVDATAAGSSAGCYVGITRTDEYNFDIIIPLPNIVTPKTLTKQDEFSNSSCFIETCACDNPYIDNVPSFGFLATDPHLTFSQDLLADDVNYCVSSEIQEHFDTFAYLSPVKVLDKFQCFVQQAVEKLERECWWEKEPTVYQIEVKVNGPSVTLTILLGGEAFTISLLPAIRFPEWPASLKQWSLSIGSNVWMTQERSALIREEFFVFAAKPQGEDASLWCICFYPFERALSNTADEGSYESCRHKCLQVMEAIYEENTEDFHPVSQRLIRTVFLHQCLQYPLDEDWTDKRLGRAFVDLFLAIIKSLKCGHCQHFFLPEKNLLGSMDKSDLKPVVHHLKAILNDIIQNPDRTAFLPIPNRIKKLRRAERKAEQK